MLVYPGRFHPITWILEVWWDLVGLTLGAWFHLSPSREHQGGLVNEFWRRVFKAQVHVHTTMIPVWVQSFKCMFAQTSILPSYGCSCSKHV